MSATKGKALPPVKKPEWPTIGHGLAVVDHSKDKNEALRVLGLGLQAAQDFAVGDVVTEYPPHYINREQEDELIQEGKHWYIQELKSSDKHGYVLDGSNAPHEDGDPGAHLLNDPRNPELVNVEWKSYEWNPLQKRPRRDDDPPVFETVVAVAKKPIRAGEELFVSYGDSLWRTFKKVKGIEPLQLAYDEKHQLYVQTGGIRSPKAKGKSKTTPRQSLTSEFAKPQEPLCCSHHQAYVTYASDLRQAIWSAHTQLQKDTLLDQTLLTMAACSEVPTGTRRLVQDHVLRRLHEQLVQGPTPTHFDAERHKAEQFVRELYTATDTQLCPTARLFEQEPCEQAWGAWGSVDNIRDWLLGCPRTLHDDFRLQQWKEYSAVGVPEAKTAYPQLEPAPASKDLVDALIERSPPLQTALQQTGLSAPAALVERDWIQALLKQVVVPLTFRGPGQDQDPASALVRFRQLLQDGRRPVWVERNRYHPAEAGLSEPVELWLRLARFAALYPDKRLACVLLSVVFVEKCLGWRVADLPREYQVVFDPLVHVKVWVEHYPLYGTNGRLHRWMQDWIAPATRALTSRRPRSDEVEVEVEVEVESDATQLLEPGWAGGNDDGPFSDLQQFWNALATRNFRGTQSPYVLSLATLHDLFLEFSDQAQTLIQWTKKRRLEAPTPSSISAVSVEAPSAVSAVSAVSERSRVHVVEEQDILNSYAQNTWRRLRRLLQETYGTRVATVYYQLLDVADGLVDLDYKRATQALTQAWQTVCAESAWAQTPLLSYALRWGWGDALAVDESLRTVGVVVAVANPLQEQARFRRFKQGQTAYFKADQILDWHLQSPEGFPLAFVPEQLPCNALTQNALASMVDDALCLDQWALALAVRVILSESTLSQPVTTLSTDQILALATLEPWALWLHQRSLPEDKPKPKPKSGKDEKEPFESVVPPYLTTLVLPAAQLHRSITELAEWQEAKRRVPAADYDLSPGQLIGRNVQRYVVHLAVSHLLGQPLEQVEEIDLVVDSARTWLPSWLSQLATADRVAYDLIMNHPPLLNGSLTEARLRAFRAYSRGESSVATATAAESVARGVRLALLDTSGAILKPPTWTDWIGSKGGPVATDGEVRAFGAVLVLHWARKCCWRLDHWIRAHPKEADARLRSLLERVHQRYTPALDPAVFCKPFDLSPLLHGAVPPAPPTLLATDVPLQVYPDNRTRPFPRVFCPFSLGEPSSGYFGLFDLEDNQAFLTALEARMLQLLFANLLQIKREEWTAQNVLAAMQRCIVSLDVTGLGAASATAVGASSTGTTAASSTPGIPAAATAATSVVGMVSVITFTDRYRVRHLLVANMGATRAMLIRRRRPGTTVSSHLTVTTTHRPYLRSEAMRILARPRGDIVHLRKAPNKWFVGPTNVDVTRGWVVPGPHTLPVEVAKCIVAQPSVADVVLTEEDQWLILGTSQLWNWWSEAQVLQLVDASPSPSPEQLFQLLMARVPATTSRAMCTVVRLNA